MMTHYDTESAREFCEIVPCTPASGDRKTTGSAQLCAYEEQSATANARSPLLRSRWKVGGGTVKPTALVSTAEYNCNRELKDAAQKGYVLLVEAAAASCAALGVSLDADYSEPAGSALAVAVRANQSGVVDWLLKAGSRLGEGGRGPAPVVLAALLGESVLLLKMLSFGDPSGGAQAWLLSHPIERIGAIMALIEAQAPTSDEVAAEVLEQMDQEQAVKDSGEGGVEDILQRPLLEGKRAGETMHARRYKVHATACDAGTCKNGGTCFDDGLSEGKFSCRCTHAWSGPTCAEPSAETLTLRALDVLVGSATRGHGLDRMWGSAAGGTSQSTDGAMTPLMAASFRGWVIGARTLLQMGYILSNVCATRVVFESRTDDVCWLPLAQCSSRTTNHGKARRARFRTGRSPSR